METTNNTNAARASVLDLDNKHVKSYATEAQLRKAMVKLGVDKMRYLLCRTPNGRWVAPVIGWEQSLLGVWPMIG